MELTITPFSSIYSLFLSKITDDMYMELTELETYEMLESLLMSAIVSFEFPRKNLNDYELLEFSDLQTYNGVESNYIDVSLIIFNEGYFNTILTLEEKNILAINMIIEWLGQQLASIENTRMKYSGADFKFTSQANHMQKILTVQKDYERKSFHLQRLYSRRTIDNNGNIHSTMNEIMLRDWEE